MSDVNYSRKLYSFQYWQYISENGLYFDESIFLQTSTNCKWKLRDQVSY